MKFSRILVVVLLTVALAAVGLSIMHAQIKRRVRIGTSVLARNIDVQHVSATHAPDIFDEIGDKGLLPPKIVHLHIDGQQHTHLAYVPKGGGYRNLLKQLGYEVNEIDQINVTKQIDTDTISIEVSRITVSEQTITEPIMPPEKKVENPQKPNGTRTVLTQGVEGLLEKTFRITAKDGEEIDRELVSVKTLREATPTIIEVGTKVVRPTYPATTACTNWDKAIDAATSDPQARDFLYFLSRCESHCNNTAVNRNGTYFGLFQFSKRTFTNYGGKNIFDGNEQIRLALDIYRKGASAGQFPACWRLYNSSK